MVMSDLMCLVVMCCCCCSLVRTTSCVVAVIISNVARHAIGLPMRATQGAEGAGREAPDIRQCSVHPVPRRRFFCSLVLQVNLIAISPLELQLLEPSTGRTFRFGKAVRCPQSVAKSASGEETFLLTA